MSKTWEDLMTDINWETASIDEKNRLIDEENKKIKDTGFQLPRIVKNIKDKTKPCFKAITVDETKEFDYGKPPLYIVNIETAIKHAKFHAHDTGKPTKIQQRSCIVSYTQIKDPFHAGVTIGTKLDPTDRWKDVNGIYKPGDYVPPEDKKKRKK